MMRFFLGLYLLVCQSLVWAQSEPVITLGGGPGYLLTLDQPALSYVTGNDKLRLRIPVAPTKEFKPDENYQIKLHDVVFMGARNSALLEQFKVRSDNFLPEKVDPTTKQEDARRGMAIVIWNERPENEVWAGTYEMTLHLTSEKSPLKDKPQVIVITLRKDPLVLSSEIATVKMQQTLPTPLLHHLIKFEPIDGMLQLAAPASIHARGALIDLRAVPELAQAGERKFLFYDDPEVKVPRTRIDYDGTPGKWIKVRPIGDFGLGINKGSIKLSSPQLAAAISVPYEVQVKRGLDVLVFLVAFGVIAGYFVRYVLARRKALADVRQVGSLLKSKLIDAAKDVKDARFLKSIAKLDEELTTAWDSATKDGKELNKTVIELQAKVTELQTKLTAELGAANTYCEPLRGFASQQWRLPPVAGPAMESFRDQVKQIEQSLKDKDAGTAQQLIGKTPILCSDLIEVCAQYLGPIGELLGKVTLSPPPISEDDRTRIRGLAELIRAKFPVPWINGSAMPDIEAAKAQILLAQECYLRAEHVLNALPSNVIDFLSRMTQDLDEGLRDTNVALAQWLQDALNGDASDFHLYGQKLDEVLKQWASVWDQGWKFLPLRNKIKEVDGWQSALEQPPSPSSGFAASLAARTDRLYRRIAPAGGASLQGGAQSALNSSWWSPPQVAPLAGSVSERQELVRLGDRASFIQALIIGLIFLFGLWVFYMDTWVGTPREMLTIVLMAFGIDLTSDSVWATFKKMKIADV